VSVPAPSISVVMPCYNGAKFLRETLDSVRAQTYQAVETIIVDDGSTDESAAIAESYGPPVRVIRQPNQGESVARNRGMQEAKGEWIAFLDADDSWLPSKLEEQVQGMTPQFDAVCTGNVTATPNANGQKDRTYTPRQEFFTRCRIMEHGAPCHISTLTVRRGLSVSFPTWTSDAEDLVYYLDLLQCTKVAIVERPLVVYRIHAGGQTSRPDMSDRRDATLRRWFELNRDKMPHDEVAALSAALQRREKWSLLSRGLARRREHKPVSALTCYTRALVGSLFTPSSLRIVHFGVRGVLGAAVESVGLRKHPV